MVLETRRNRPLRSNKRRQRLGPAQGSEAEWTKHREARRTFWLTGVSAIAALIACAFSGLQWWEVHNEGELTKRQAEAAAESAAQARREADAANRQASIAADTVAVLRLSVAAQRDAAVAGHLQASAAADLAGQSRPRVVVTFAPPPTFAAGLPAPILVAFENTSDMPAEGLQTRSYATIGSYPPDPKALLDELKSARYARGNQSNLGPHQQNFGHPALAVVKPDDLAAVADGRKRRLVAAAVATYRDARGRAHHSYGCATWYQPGLARRIDCYIGPDD